MINLMLRNAGRYFKDAQKFQNLINGCFFRQILTDVFILTIPSTVITFKSIEICFLKPLVISIHGSHHSRPRLFEDLYIQSKINTKYYSIKNNFSNPICYEVGNSLIFKKIHYIYVFIEPRKKSNPKKTELRRTEGQKYIRQTLRPSHNPG